ncbi:ArgE/DapE family deacylase [bacterium]|nr:ArgE/DapE family deacylase [bacterium]
MNWKNELKLWFEQHEQEGIDLLCELVKKDTTNPPGNEYLAVEVVQSFLEKYDIESETYEAEPGRTNLLAKVGTGNPTVFLPVHTDVVPAGNGWSTNPFEPTIKDGYIFGRGVTDDKGPLVSVLLLATFLKKYENEFKGSILVGAVADEECGSKLGVSYLLEKGVIDADYAIVPDTGSSIFSASTGEKAMLQMKVKFYGEQAHASIPEKGLSAIWAANDFLNGIQSLFKNETGYFADDGDILFSPSTINVGKLSAGTAYNIVPNECEIFIDIRYTPNTTKENVLKIIRQLAGKVQNKGLCLDFEITEEEHMLPFVISENNPVVNALKNAVMELKGKEISFFGMPGTTVCKQLVEEGIPAVGFSQDAEEQAHMANERLKLSEIGLFGQALGLSIINLTD